MLNILTNVRHCPGKMSSYCTLKDFRYLLFKRCYSEKAVSTYPRKFISGIQPTGTVHLGNYIGAIKKWVELQNNNEEMICFIADMHAITIPQEPELLRHNILKLCAILLACGIDPNTLFQQSRINASGELFWILSTLLMTNRLTHLHHYKAKTKDKKYMLHGLLSYPILQAADILLFKATHVPVGEDQVQHVNLVCHIAQKFNNTFGQTFPMPEAVISTIGNRIKSLRDPMKKMSKSDFNTKSRIEVIDDPDSILFKLKKATTDVTSKVTYDNENRPGVSNLITIHSLITGKSFEEICKEAEELDTGKYKIHLADVIIETLKPIRNKYFQLIEEPDYLIEVLEKGTEKAKVSTSTCMQEVYEKIGFSFNNIKSLSSEQLKTAVNK